jgi:hypothetical protein
MTQPPLALLGDLRRARRSTTALKLARTLGRNRPLLLLPAIVATLFLPAETLQQAEDVKGIPTAFIPLRLLH